MSSSSDPSACSAMKPKKSSSDRHRKVDGRDRRVLMSPACARLLSEVSVRLGHGTIGQTIEWLIVQAKASVDAVIGDGSSYPLPSQLVMNTNLSLNVHLFPISNTSGFDFPISVGDPPSLMAISKHPDGLHRESDVNISPEMIDNFFF